MFSGCRTKSARLDFFALFDKQSKVNCFGNFPYAGGQKGQYRETTVPVKSLPANRWGLYEMHGNVWEWCADGVMDGNELRPYPQQQEGEIFENPFQIQGRSPSARRVLRGGSWFRAARYCRSAHRLAGGRDRRHGDVGFRFALRSSSPVL